MFKALSFGFAVFFWVFFATFAGAAQFTVSSVSPSDVSLGTVVNVTGQGFQDLAVSGQFSIGGYPSSVAKWSATSVSLVTPDQLVGHSNNVTVSYQQQTTTLGSVTLAPTALSKNSRPSLTSVAPQDASFETQVTLNGSFFGAFQGTSYVSIGGERTEVLSWSDSTILTKISAAVPSGTNQSVLVVVGGVASNKKSITIYPTLFSVTPNFGAQNSFFTLLGANFGYKSQSVMFNLNGRSTKSNYLVWGPDAITGAVPRLTPGVYSVYVDTGVNSNALAYTVIPFISSISPILASGLQTVTVTGDNFGSNQAGSTLTVGTDIVSPLSWSDSQIQFVVPSSLTAGVLPVSVKVSGVSSNVPYLTVKPTITQVTPSIVSGGDFISLTGMNFGPSQSSSRLLVGGTSIVPAAWGQTLIQFTLPATIPAGNRDVVLEIGGIQSSPYPIIVFPKLSSVSKETGTGRDVITITGTGLGASQGSSAFLVNGVSFAPNFWSDTSIQWTIPNYIPAGQIVLSVIVGGKPSNSLSMTVYPSIKGFSRISGIYADEVIVLGTNFDSTDLSSALYLGSIQKLDAVWGYNQVSFLVPSDLVAGPYNITVSVNGLVSNTAAFTIIPFIQSVNQAAGGAIVTLTGANFGSTQGTGVLALGTVNITAQSWSPTSIVFKVPNNITAGLLDVNVRVNGIPSNVVTISVKPTITQASPSNVVAGDSISLLGTNFGSSQSDSRLLVGGTPIAASTWGQTLIQFTMPATIPAGNRDVVLEVGGIQSSPYPISVLPKLTSISVTSGTGGDIVVITGTGFGPSQGSSFYSVNGSALTPTIWGDTSIQWTIPNNVPAGIKSISVIVGGKTSNTLNLTIRPTITGLSRLSGVYGDQVIVLGSNFDAAAPSSNQLFLGAVEPFYGSWGSSQVTFSVLSDLEAGTYDVTVRVNGIASNGKSFTLNPFIQYVNKTQLYNGDVFIAHGKSFGTNPGNIFFGGQALQITSWSSTEVDAVITPEIVAGSMASPVHSFLQTSLGGNLDLGLAIFPTINSISSVSVHGGQSVTITGANFGDTTQTAVQWQLAYFPITASAYNSLTFTIPDYVLGLNSPPFTGPQGVLTVAIRQASVTVPYFVVNPTLLLLSPTSASGADSISIAAANLGAQSVRNFVIDPVRFSSPATLASTGFGLKIPDTIPGGIHQVFIETLTNKNGTNFWTTSNSLPITIRPTIKSISSQVGTGGNLIVLTGTNFGPSQGASSLFLGGNLLTASSWSDLSISFTLPSAGLAGVYPVGVTVGGVGSNTVSLSALPEITAISSTREAGGAIDVTLIGTNFGSSQGSSLLNWGGASSIAQTWSTTSITFTLPTNVTAGVYDVNVRVNGLSSNVVTISVKPTITQANPSNVVAGDSISLLGTNFGSSQSGSRLLVGGTPIAASTWGQTLIQFTMPATVPAGNRDLVLQVGGVQSSPYSISVFPKLSAVSVTSGTGGDLVVITGTGFGPSQGSSSFLVNGSVFTPSIWGDTSIQWTIPNSVPAGVKSISVVVGGKTSNLLNFTIRPTITGLSRSSGVYGDQVIVFGSNFDAATPASNQLFLGSVKPSSFSWGSSQVTFSVFSDLEAGTYDVTVRVNGIASNGVTFTLNPYIQYVNKAQLYNGDVFILYGKSFGTNPGKILFGGQAIQINYWSPTEVDAVITPEIVAGSHIFPVDSFLQTSSGGTAGLYMDIIPSITSISSVSVHGGQSVTITGANFGDDTQTAVQWQTVHFPITASNYDALTVKIPDFIPGLNSSPYIGPQGSLYVEVRSFYAVTVPYFVVNPTLLALSPDSASGAASISIAAVNLGIPQSVRNFVIDPVRFSSPATLASTGFGLKIPETLPGGIHQVFIETLTNNNGTFAWTTSNSLPITIRPTIKSISSQVGTGGNLIVLTGTNFGPSQGDSSLFLGGYTISPSSWTSNSVTFAIPTAIDTGTLALKVRVGGIDSNSLNFTVIPHISSLSPSVVTGGTQVSLVGTNLGVSENSSLLTVNGQPLESTSWSSTFISFQVPVTLTSGTYQLSVDVNGFSTAPTALTIKPSLLGTSPQSGGAGDTIELSGANLGLTKDVSNLTLGGTPVLVRNWSQTGVTFVIPSSIMTGAQTLQVIVSGLPSNTLPFDVTWKSLLSSNLVVSSPNSIVSSIIYVRPQTGLSFSLAQNTLYSLVEYQIDGGMPVTYSTPFTLPGNPGMLISHHITYHAYDTYLEQTEPMKHRTLIVDLHPPKTELVNPPSVIYRANLPVTLTTATHEPRVNSAVVAALGKAFVIGGSRYAQFGFGTSTMDAFDPKDGTWAPRAPPPVAVEGAAAVYDSAQNRILLYGGHNDSLVAPYTEAGVWAYDLAQDSWSLVNATGPQRQFFAYTWDDAARRLYVHGGEIQTGRACCKTVRDEVWAFDAAANSWVSLGHADARSHHAAALESDNSILLIGGTGSVLRFLFSSGATETVISNFSRPGPRKDFTWLVDGRSAYLYGGLDQGGVAGDFWRFDIPTLKWNIETTSSTMGPRWGMAATQLNGETLFFGGADSPPFEPDPVGARGVKTLNDDFTDPNLSLNYYFQNFTGFGEAYVENGALWLDSGQVESGGPSSANVVFSRLAYPLTVMENGNVGFNLDVDLGIIEMTPQAIVSFAFEKFLGGGGARPVVTLTLSPQPGFLVGDGQSQPVFVPAPLTPFTPIPLHFHYEIAADQSTKTLEFSSSLTTQTVTLAVDMTDVAPAIIVGGFSDGFVSERAKVVVENIRSDLSQEVIRWSHLPLRFGADNYADDFAQVQLSGGTSAFGLLGISSSIPGVILYADQTPVQLGDYLNLNLFLLNDPNFGQKNTVFTPGDATLISQAFSAAIDYEASNALVTDVAGNYRWNLRGDELCPDGRCVYKVGTADPLQSVHGDLWSVELTKLAYCVNGAFNFALQSTDEAGVSSIAYAINGSLEQTYTMPLVFPSEGTYGTSYHAVDRLGNQESMAGSYFYSDRSGPDVMVGFAGPVTEVGGMMIIGQATKVYPIAHDSCGVGTVELKVDSGPWTGWQSEVTLPAGQHDILVRANDLVGNSHENTPIQVTVDDQAPAILVNVGNPRRETNGLFTVGPQTPITVHVEDPEGVNRFEFSDNDRTWFPITGSTLTYFGQGTSTTLTRYFRAYDSLGNVSKQTVSLGYDAVPPIPGITVSGISHELYPKLWLITSQTPIYLTALGATGETLNVTYQYQNMPTAAVIGAGSNPGALTFSQDGLLYWTVSDDLGNQSTSQEAFVVKDHAPVITFQTPLLFSDPFTPIGVNIASEGGLQGDRLTLNGLTVYEGSNVYLRTSDSITITNPNMQEGTNEVVASATDLLGRTTTVLFSPTLDTTPPALTLTQPVSSPITAPAPSFSLETSTSTLNIRGTLADASNVNLILTLDRVSWTIGIGGIGSYQQSIRTTMSIPVGVYGDFATTVVSNQDEVVGIGLTGVDEVGHARVITFSWTHVAQPPWVEIVTPRENEIIKSPTVNVGVLVQGAASSAQISVQGDYATATTSAWWPPSAHAIQFSTLTSLEIPLPFEGTNRIYANAQDSVGHKVGVIRTVIRDTQDPVLTVYGESITASHVPTFSFVGNVYDATLSYLTVNGTPIVVDGTGTFGITETLVSGFNTFNFVAGDLGGRETIVSRTIYYSPCSVCSVSVKILSPVNHSTYFTPSLTVSGTAYPDGITVYVTSLTTVTTQAHNGVFSASVPLLPGRNAIRVVAQGFLLSATDTLDDIIYNSTMADQDVTAPTIVVDQPADGSFSQSSAITLSGSVTDNEGIDRLLVNGATVPVSSDGRFLLTVSLPNEGLNSVNLTAYDSSNNVTSSTIEVIVDTNKPVITLSVSDTADRTPIDLVGTVIDEYPLASFSINNIAVPLYGASSPFTFATTADLLVGSNNLFRFRAADQAGNENAPFEKIISLSGNPPALEFVEPQNGNQFYKPPTEATLSVLPTMGDLITGVTLNGAAATFRNGFYKVPLTLVNGVNTLTASAFSASHLTRTKSIQVEFDDPQQSPLEIVKISPTNSSGIPVDSWVKLYFNRPYDPSSVPAALKMVSGTTEIPVAFSIIPGNMMLVVSPRSPLTYRSRVQLIVDKQKLVALSPSNTTWLGLGADYTYEWDVVPAPTSLHGVIYATDMQPLVNADVSVDGTFHLKTDAFGNFTVDFGCGPTSSLPLCSAKNPTLVTVRIEKEGYNTVVRHDLVQRETTRNLPPLFLTALSSSGIAQIPASATTKVSFGSEVPDFSLVVTAGTANFADGTVGGVVRATEIDRHFVPVPVLNNWPVQYAVSVQPVGIRLSEPAMVTFKNVGLKEGQKVVILDYSPTRGILRPISLGEVKGDVVVSYSGVFNLDYLAYFGLTDAQASQIIAQLAPQPTVVATQPQSAPSLAPMRALKASGARSFAPKALGFTAKYQKASDVPADVNQFVSSTGYGGYPSLEGSASQSLGTSTASGVISGVVRSAGGQTFGQIPIQLVGAQEISQTSGADGKFAFQYNIVPAEYWDDPSGRVTALIPLAGRASFPAMSDAFPMTGKNAAADVVIDIKQVLGTLHLPSSVTFGSTYYDPVTGGLQGISANDLVKTEVYVFKSDNLATPIAKVESLETPGGSPAFHTIVVGPYYGLGGAPGIRLKAGDEITIVAVNRATGMVGYKRHQVQASEGLNIDVGDVTFVVPNLEVRILRTHTPVGGGVEQTHLVGPHGVALTSDRSVIVKTRYDIGQGISFENLPPGIIGPRGRVIMLDSTLTGREVHRFDIAPSSNPVKIDLPELGGSSAGIANFVIDADPDGANPTFDGRTFSTPGVTETLFGGALLTHFVPMMQMAERHVTSVLAQGFAADGRPCWKGGDFNGSYPETTATDAVKIEARICVPEAIYSKYYVQPNSLVIQHADNTSTPYAPGQVPAIQSGDVYLNMLYFIQSSGDEYHPYDPANSLLSQHMFAVRFGSQLKILLNYAGVWEVCDVPPIGYDKDVLYTPQNCETMAQFALDPNINTSDLLFVEMYVWDDPANPYQDSGNILFMWGINDSIEVQYTPNITLDYTDPTSSDGVSNVKADWNVDTLDQSMRFESQSGFYVTGEVGDTANHQGGDLTVGVPWSNVFYSLPAYNDQDFRVEYSVLSVDLNAPLPPPLPRIVSSKCNEQTLTMDGALVCGSVALDMPLKQPLAAVRKIFDTFKEVLTYKSILAGFMPVPSQYAATAKAFLTKLLEFPVRFRFPFMFKKGELVAALQANIDIGLKLNAPPTVTAYLGNWNENPDPDNAYVRWSPTSGVFVNSDALQVSLYDMMKNSFITSLTKLNVKMTDLQQPDLVASTISAVATLVLNDNNGSGYTVLAELKAPTSMLSPLSETTNQAIVKIVTEQYHQSPAVAAQVLSDAQVIHAALLAQGTSIFDTLHITELIQNKALAIQSVPTGLSDGVVASAPVVGLTISNSQVHVLAKEDESESEIGYDAQAKTVTLRYLNKMLPPMVFETTLIWKQEQGFTLSVNEPSRGSLSFYFDPAGKFKNFDLGYHINDHVALVGGYDSNGNPSIGVSAIVADCDNGSQITLDLKQGEPLDPFKIRDVSLSANICDSATFTASHNGSDYKGSFVASLDTVTGTLTVDTDAQGILHVGGGLSSSVGLGNGSAFVMNIAGSWSSTPAVVQSGTVREVTLGLSNNDVRHNFNIVQKVTSDPSKKKLECSLTVDAQTSGIPVLQVLKGYIGLSGPCPDSSKVNIFNLGNIKNVISASLQAVWTQN